MVTDNPLAVFRGCTLIILNNHRIFIIISVGGGSIAPIVFIHVSIVAGRRRRRRCCNRSRISHGLFLFRRFVLILSRRKVHVIHKRFLRHSTRRHQERHHQGCYFQSFHFLFSSL
jgi:hypothetical protein